MLEVMRDLALCRLCRAGISLNKMGGTTTCCFRNTCVLRHLTPSLLLRTQRLPCHRSIAVIQTRLYPRPVGLSSKLSAAQFNLSRLSATQTRTVSTTVLAKSSLPGDKSEQKTSGDKDTTSAKPLTQRQRLAIVFAEYGTAAVVFHTCISLTSLGICYTIVSSGIDMVGVLQKIGLASEGLQGRLTSGASTFVVAYACHKVFMPVRVFLTVTCTPLIVRKLRQVGFLRVPVKKPES